MSHPPTPSAQLVHTTTRRHDESIEVEVAYDGFKMQMLVILQSLSTNKYEVKHITACTANGDSWSDPKALA